MHKVDLAFVTARGDNGPQSSVDLLMEYIDEVKEEYYKDTDYFGYQWLGIEEKFNIERNNLKVFPNPAKSEIWINYQTKNDVVITIHDMFGRQLRQQQIRPDGAIRVSIEGLKKGLYVVTLQDGKALYTTKLMKE
jgi:hypothetical protein